MTKQSTQTTTSGPEAEASDEKIGSPTRIHRVSPWPPFIALGFAVAEIGIVLNLVSIAIGGLLLFGGSVAGILSETKYVRRPSRTLVFLGGLFVVAGAVIYGSQVGQFAVAVPLTGEPINAIAMRGEAITVAGLLLLVGAIVSRLTRTNRTEG